MTIGNKTNNPKEDNTSKSEVPVESGCIKIRVMHLNDESKPFEIILRKNLKGSELMKKYCDSITVGGLLEADYFGLRFTDKDKQRQWLDLDKPIFKQLKNCHGHHHSRNSYGLSFRVKHYPKVPLADLTQNISKYLLYLQIRRDLKQGRLLCPEDQTAKIGGLILQAEFGPCKYANLEEFNEAGEFNDLNNNIPISSEKTAVTSFELNVSNSSPNQSVTPPTGGTAVVDPRLEFMGKDFTVLLNQTHEVKLSMAKSHVQLSELEASEAESEVLTNVCMWPTYGVDPYRVEPLFEMVNRTTGFSTSSSSRAEEISQKSKTAPTLSLTNGVNRPTKISSTYLCIKDDGLATFIGVSMNELYPWTEIVKMRCEDSNFVMLVKAKDAKKVKDEKLAFKCESKSAAYSLWHWANDRKCFFTLLKANQAKKMRMAKKLFSKSFRFSGTTQAELRDKLANTEHVPQPSFIRAASLRRPSGSPNKPNFSHHATLPARIKGGLAGVARSPLCVHELVKEELQSETKKTAKLSNVMEESVTEVEEEVVIVPTKQPIANAGPNEAQVTPSPSFNNTSEREDALKQLDSEIAKHEKGGKRPSPPLPQAARANGHVKPLTQQQKHDHDNNNNEKKEGSATKWLAMVVTATLIFFFLVVMESKPNNRAGGGGSGLNKKPYLQSYGEMVRTQPLVNTFAINVYDPIRGALISIFESMFAVFTK